MKQVVSALGTRPFGVWSPAIVTDRRRLLFVSGLTARDDEGNVMAVDDVGAQTQRVCELLQKTVEEVGATLADVVAVTVYVRNMDDFDIIHDVRRRFFPTEPPTSSMVEVSRLVDSRSLIEISAIAALPTDH